jgi:hypothetical protein
MTRRTKIDVKTVVVAGCVGLGSMTFVLVAAMALLLVTGDISIASDRDAAPEKANAAAAWAGFPDTAKMTIRSFSRRDLHGDGWHLGWEGSSEQVDRMMAAGGFTATFESCRSEPSAEADPGVVDGCRTARETWRRPDGNAIDRRVVRGRTRRGTYVVYVHVLDPG